MKNEILGYLRIAAVVFLIMFLFAYGYPTLVSEAEMHINSDRANGSLVIENHTVYGSIYLAEAFNYSEFFHPRPSSINYNLSDSGVYNYSIDNPALLNLTKGYIKNFEANNPDINVSEIPYSMVSYSGSGLDPSISVKSAYIQIPRISQNLTRIVNSESTIPIKGSTIEYLYNLVNGSSQQNFPLFGTYYVNTLKLDFSILLYLENDYGINLF